MKLTIDGHRLSSADYSGHTLAELINDLESRFTPGRVIVSMTLDGQALNQADEKLLASKALGDLDDLEIRTQKVASLARSTLHTLVDYLPGLVNNVTECVEQLQGKDEIEGHLSLSNLIDGLQMVSSAWKGIALFIAIEGRQPEQVMPEMGEFYGVLRGIVNSQETGDTVRMCDLLEFELNPILREWHAHASRVRDLLGATS